MSAPFDWLADWEQPSLTGRPLRVIGIDLGTTNSTITEIVWQPDSEQKPNPEVIDVLQATHLGQEFTADVVPSVVALIGGKPLVGEGANRLRGTAEPHLTRNQAIFWECKNEMGTRRSYALAPEGFKTPRDIAMKVLKFLHEAAEDYAPAPIDRVVITVPASFGWEQRQDTFTAAEGAGLDVRAGDLLDEPVAAFLDYLAMHGSADALGRRAVSRVMVLDFGGGTCDVALLEVRTASGGAGALNVSRLGVSRFHRIGGGDIDAAIAFDVLMPQLLQQNGMPAHKFRYTDKRDYLVPALSGIAASLKVKLSELVRVKQRLGVFDAKDPALQVSLPGVSVIPWGKRGGEVKTLKLTTPTLTYTDLTKSLRPFLSRNVLMARDNEYVHAQSVFAPVADVLQRCDLDPGDVDACLMVGGSSLLPQLVEAVEAYLPDAAILKYKEPRDALRCVGRGAAFHAMLLAAYGRSPLAPTTGDSVGIRTRQGTETIVPRNASLPYPDSEGWATVDTLRMANGDGTTQQQLTLQIMSGSDANARTLGLHPVTVEPPVRAGDPITLFVRVDENQRLQLRAEVRTASGVQAFDLQLDNPFSATVNPNAKREQIQELEERSTELQGAQMIAAVEELARLHFDIGERERAREYYERIVAHVPPHKKLYVLNMLGIISGELGDTEAQLEYYRTAADAGGDTVPLFNLALALRDRGEFTAALAVSDEVMARGARAEDHALRAGILEGLGRLDEARQEWEKAAEKFPLPRRASDFQLSWMGSTARELGDRAKMREIKDEAAKRRRDKDAPSDDDVVGLPDRA